MADECNKDYVIKKLLDGCQFSAYTEGDLKKAKALLVENGIDVVSMNVYDRCGCKYSDITYCVGDGIDTTAYRLTYCWG